LLPSSARSAFTETKKQFKSSNLGFHSALYAVPRNDKSIVTLGKDNDQWSVDQFPCVESPHWVVHRYFASACGTQKDIEWLISYASLFYPPILGSSPVFLDQGGSLEIKDAVAV
jgi:hypothetical protein